VTVHAIDDLIIDLFNAQDLLATQRLPSLYDFLENSAFAEDVSVTLEALYVAFGNVKIFQNAGSARTMLIPTNEAWRKLFAETSLTKSMLFKDESNQDQLKNIVLRFLVSSFQQLKASSGAMMSFAQSYGGDDFILVEDIRTADGLLMIVSGLPLKRNARRKESGVEILRPGVSVTKERQSLFVYKFVAKRKSNY
jgi:hypothetical protein